MDPINVIMFKNLYGNDYVEIEQEEVLGKGVEVAHCFRSIYKFKMHVPTLRELLILQSFYMIK